MVICIYIYTLFSSHILENSMYTSPFFNHAKNIIYFFAFILHFLFFGYLTRFYIYILLMSFLPTFLVLTDIHGYMHYFFCEYYISLVFILVLLVYYNKTLHSNLYVSIFTLLATITVRTLYSLFTPYIFT